jgi:hypothetical protein
MNLKEFKTRLANHDWYYSQSDDSRIYSKSLAEETALKELMQGRKTYKQAYEKQFKKYFNEKNASTRNKSLGQGSKKEGKTRRNVNR